MTKRRGAWKIVFGEGTNRWSMGDPGHPRIRQARRAAAHRSLDTTSEDVSVLASIVDDLHYLVHVCPTTKLACEKLAALRAGVRELPIEDDGGDA
jgi:hypothetical protein